MVSFGSLYHLIPRVYGREQMHSIALINAHFWLATIGTVLYVVAMWVNGIMQGLMWRAVNNDGTLTYSFIESVVASEFGYIVRAIGGAFFVAGVVIMAYNVYRTSQQPAQDTEADASTEPQAV